MNIIAWSVVWDLNKPGFLEVVFFDIGEGDSIFIETPQRHQILIDGGPTSAILEKLVDEMPFFDRTIDLIILTHPEKDHLFGLLEVLKRYKVKNILWTGIIRETAEWQEWKRLIEKEGAEIKITQSGQKIIFPVVQNSYDRGNFGQLVLNILFPSENLEGHVLKDSNDTSIVAKLVFREISFLFTGDITKRAEKDLRVDSDVLKVAHHGSKSSSGSDFLEAVSPEIAVISAGKDNRYGHPHQEVLETLERYGITVLRTDRNGDIKIISDGSNLKILKLKIDN